MEFVLSALPAVVEMTTMSVLVVRPLLSAASSALLFREFSVAIDLIVVVA